MCLLTRRKALQQSISDYKHGAPAYMSMRRKDRRKNRARGEGQRAGGRDKAVKVESESEVAVDGAQVQAQYLYSLAT